MFDNDTRALESFMDYSAMMIAEEGANIESWGKFKTYRKEFHDELLAASALMKKEKYKEASKHLKNAKSDLEKTAKEIDACKSTFGSVIAGAFFGWLPIIGRDLIALIVKKFPPIINTAGHIERIATHIKMCKRQKKFTADQFNIFKTSVNEKLMEYEAILDGLIRICNSKELAK